MDRTKRVDVNEDPPFLQGMYALQKWPKFRIYGSLMVILAGTLFCFPTVAAERDSDGDTIPDVQEEQWGSDPQRAEVFTTIFKFDPLPPARLKAAQYDPGMDIEEVAVAHVAEDRYLWRATFKGRVVPTNMVFHLYINADRASTTGRRDGVNTIMGTDFMVTVAGGRARMGVYDENGRNSVGAAPYYYAAGNQFYVMSDSPLPVVDGVAGAALYVLCHGITSDGGKASKMSVSSGKQFEFSCAWHAGVKRKRPYDCYELEGFERTFGIAMIREQLYNNPEVIFIAPDKLKLDGFESNLFTQDHFAQVKVNRSRGLVAAAAPKGSYHAGFLIFDRSGDDTRFVMHVQGKAVGWAPVNVDNQRYWLYYSKERFDFHGGEDVTLTACGSGPHRLAGLVFFKQPPPTGELPYKVHHLTTRCPPESSGEVSLSWITEMPSLTRLEYGLVGDFSQVAESGVTNTVHRINLSALDPRREYNARAVGVRPDGQRYVTDAVRFRALAKRPDVVGARAQVSVEVKNPYAFTVANQLCTSGFPFPQGVLAHSDNVRLLASDGSEVPAQIKSTAWWPDNSVKWILVSFRAVAVPAQGVETFTLEYGSAVKRATYGAPLVTLAAGLPQVQGCAQISFNRQGEVLGPDGRACRLKMRLQDTADIQQSGVGRFTLEESGPVCAVIKVERDFVRSDGTPVMAFETRYTLWRDSPAVNVQQTMIVQGSEQFTLLEELSLEVPTVTSEWHAATIKDEAISLSRSPLQQRFDNQYLLEGSVVTGRLNGVVLAKNQAVALRNFWQNYPKALALGDGYLRLMLCPDFAPGLYDTFPFEREGHHLYFYLLNGVYKFRAGMAKTDEFQLCWGVERQRAHQMAQVHQAPLLAAATPEWYCKSGAFYPLAARDSEKFRVYESMIDKKVAAYQAARERQRDYGLMNFGDWYGERGANWGNSEYDTQSALLLEYVRSGNREAFFLADDMEKHNRDIDTIHWSGSGAARTLGVGAVYVHQMGHVGGYYTNSVPGTLGIPRAGSSVDHAWNEGHFYHYFLTGDPRSRESALAIADFFIRRNLSQPYHFTSCRVPGWHLILNASTLAATGDPYYLNASRVIVERVLELQDKTPIPLFDYQREAGRQEFHVGGWSRMMVPGHCHCTPRHRGNANFMVAVLLSGLKYYHDVTDEPRVKEAIIAGARALLAECYSPEAKGFRYTSCPQMKFTYGASPLMVEGIARAYLWTRDPQLCHPLAEALMNTQSGNYGKSFSNYYRMAPRVLADLAAAGLTWNQEPEPKRR